MVYTVKKLASLSGVSIRTLHYYDEIDLLNPAFLGSNGYRYYEEAQLLRLQQILFYRELDVDLKNIKRILDDSNFDLISAMESHQKRLTDELERKKSLIQTVAKTIQHLKGTQSMNSEEIFEGFDSEKQKEHEQYLIDRCGEPMKQSITQSKEKTKNWSKDKWRKTLEDFDILCEGIIRVMNTGAPPESPKAQELIRRHYKWMCQFWTPTRESYQGHSQLILDSELRSAYTKHHPDLPEYTVEGIFHFAEHELD